jgi:DNA-binding MarR family transcriptional regulator
MRVWRDFLAAHARLTEVLGRELEHERRLPLPWYDVLVTLSEAPDGRLRMGELAAAVAFSRSGLTRLVDRMATAGVVTRHRSTTDRRVTFAELTQEGRTVLRRAAPTHLRGVDAYFTSLVGEDEAVLLHRFFTRVIERLNDLDTGRERRESDHSCEDGRPLK